MDKHDIYIKIENEIQKNKDGLTELGRELFNHPEPGFKEVESNKILTSFLRENGISCRSDICLTGIRAEIGNGEGYHIALVADMFYHVYRLWTTGRSVTPAIPADTASKPPSWPMC